MAGKMIIGDPDWNKKQSGDSWMLVVAFFLCVVSSVVALVLTIVVLS